MTAFVAKTHTTCSFNQSVLNDANATVMGYIDHALECGHDTVQTAVSGVPWRELAWGFNRKSTNTGSRHASKAADMGCGLLREGPRKDTLTLAVLGMAIRAGVHRSGRDSILQLVIIEEIDREMARSTTTNRTRIRVMLQVVIGTLRFPHSAGVCDNDRVATQLLCWRHSHFKECKPGPKHAWRTIPRCRAPLVSDILSRLKPIDRNNRGAADVIQALKGDPWRELNFVRKEKPTPRFDVNPQHQDRPVGLTRHSDTPVVTQVAQRLV